MIDYENSRDDLVQVAADVVHTLASRARDGVLAGLGGVVAAAGAGLLSATAAVSRWLGLAVLLVGGVILVVALWRSALDWIKAGRARRNCRAARLRYLNAKRQVMETCLRECWPSFVDVACL